MDDGLGIWPQTRDWLRRSVLEIHVSEYCSYLHGRRYAASTRRVYLCCVAHFSHWMTEGRLPLADLDEQTVARFLFEHLPRCRCQEPVRRLVHENRAALAHLLKVLRIGEVIGTRPKHASDIEAELVRFDKHMERTRGLADNTRRNRVRIIRRFLIGRFGSRSVDVARLKPGHIRRFLREQANSCCAGSMQVIVSSLRSYLSFRAIAGDKVRVLLAALPGIAHWRLAPLPEALSEVEIEQLLRSFDQPFPSAKRAYGIVRCLVDLGLRSREVVQLRLDDIDWRAGTVRLATGKSRRADILPLPHETARAISDYLLSERPQTTNRAVFVRHVAPRDEPIGIGVVNRAVRNAYRRCGWTRTRVHILRHTVASRLLRAGTPLKEIADVLRHRSLDTSAIYTKIDTTRLAAVALPWPECAS